MSSAPIDLLLLDFGGVCLLNPVELHQYAIDTLGIDAAAVNWLGPLDPSTDPLWESMIEGQLTEREYWARRAADVGAAIGRPDLSTREYMSLLYQPARPELIRAAASHVVIAAREAGFAVSLLTNDMRAFHGRDWESGIEFLALMDHVVDCSDHAFLKPDRRAFDLAASTTGVPPERTLFVDDQPGNIAGAVDAGLQTMWFDIANAGSAWRDVAAALGVSSIVPEPG